VYKYQKFSRFILICVKSVAEMSRDNRDVADGN